ncbi:sulfotransferase [Microbulbifer bruguierae]|uniref:Sulfotransferase n=1 Tax=Microbulbifer bruguierae TaxID=3029061 RepID=A0ABY8NF30_9GAMM|nr:sulfotransferase [Microbulbifer bruguierae]WGL17290.1 sulfotransferase [Microbulbifer bruguierae]
MPIDKIFLSVGAMKAGTTFLYNVFREHPDLHFTPEKELHYFAHIYGLDRKLQVSSPSSLKSWLSRNVPKKRLILSQEFRRHRLSMVMHNKYSKIEDPDKLRHIVNWYADRYLKSPVDQDWFESVFHEAGDRYACDFSNYHALLPSSGWRDIKKNVKKIRVIYILREPVSRLWSHIKFHLIQTGNHESLKNLSEHTIDKILRETSSIAAHGKYGNIIKHLKKNLDQDQLRIIPFEDLINNFEKTVKDIEGFLEISPFDYKHVNIKKKSNPSVDIQLTEELKTKLKNIVNPELDQLKNLNINVPSSYFFN